MVDVWEVEIPQLTGEEKRRVYLYLPDSYEEDEERYYPVLYMFDGHNVFFDEDATYGKSWGMKEYMDFTETQLLIVGVECNHSPDFGRLKEYSPYNFRDPEFGNITGKGRITMEWFVNELKPEIDENFRTKPDREHTFIAGSSMGGLMSVYALLEYNHIFSRAAALSPSLWANSRRIRELIRTAPIGKDTILYLDYGELEIGYRPNIEKKVQQMCALLMERGVLLTSRIVPGGTHSEASWERQLPIFMSTLMYGIEDEDDLEEGYSEEDDREEGYPEEGYSEEDDREEGYSEEDDREEGYPEEGSSEEYPEE